MVYLKYAGADREGNRMDVTTVGESSHRVLPHALHLGLGGGQKVPDSLTYLLLF